MELDSGQNVARLQVVPTPEEEQGWGDFPIAVYPAWARTWCRQAAWALQMAVDVFALMLLGVMGGCTGRTVRVWPRPGWCESTTTWVAVVLGSGERKSVAVKLLAEPIHKFEERQKASYLERLLRWMALLAQVEDALDSLVAERKKLERKEADLRARLVLEQDEVTRREIEEQLAEIVARKQALVGQIAALRAQRKMLLEDVPYARRVRVNDITPVALKRFLYRNEGRGLVLDSEASFLDNISRYGRDALPVYLAAEAGDRITHDRAKDALELVIDDPSLSLALMPQPHVLETLARLRGARERGLLARLLITFPQSRMGQRDTNPVPMDDVVHARYVYNILRLLSWTHELKGTVDLVLSPGAQTVFTAFCAQIEAQLAQDETLGDTDLRAWGSKLPGRALKIAAHIHMMNHLATVPDGIDLVGFGSRLPEEIERRSMEGAIKVARHLIPHALVAFETMLGGQALADAECLMSWARRNTLAEFSRRDARRAFARSIQRSPECDWRLDHALRLLLSVGEIALKDPPAKDGQVRMGRPHSQVYVVITQVEED